MAAIGSESGSGFDHILKNTEFENDQQLKSIKAERERIQAYQSQLNEKQTQIRQLEKSISGLDEHVKQLHKQFSINRDNCESLKRTTSVLADHEEALKAKFMAVEKEVEAERLHQNMALSKYDSIWDKYRAKYDSLEKAQSLKRSEIELTNLRQENAAIEMQIGQIEETLHTLQHPDDDDSSLVSMVLKMAKLHVETEQTRRLTSTASEEIAKLQKEKSTLCDVIIRTEELAKEREREREINEQQHNEDTSLTNEAMEVDDSGLSSTTNPVSTEEHQQLADSQSTAQSTSSTVPSGGQLSKTFPVLQTSPVPRLSSTSVVTARQQSTAASRFRLDFPRLTMPTRIPTRTQRSDTSSIPNVSAPTQSIKVPKIRPSSSIQIPDITMDTPSPIRSISSRPVVPEQVIQAPIQTRPQPLSGPPLQEVPNSVSLAPHASFLVPEQPSVSVSQSMLPASISSRPVVPEQVIQTPIQTRPQSLSSTIEPPLQEASNSVSLAPHASFLMPKQPNVSVSQSVLLASSSLTITSQPKSSSVVSSNYKSVIPQPVQGPVPNPQQFSTSSDILPPVETETHQNITPDEARAHETDQDHPNLQPSLVTESVDECLRETQPHQQEENVCEAESVEQRTQFDVQGSSDNTSFFNTDLYSGDQIYSNYDTGYADMGEATPVNFQGGEGMQSEEAMFTGDGDTPLFYGLEGHLDGQGNQPDMSAAGTPGGSFMEGFNFDNQETTSSATSDNTTEGFSIFGSNNANQTQGASDFSFSFGGSETPTTGSFGFF